MLGHTVCSNSMFFFGNAKEDRLFALHCILIIITCVVIYSFLKALYQYNARKKRYKRMERRIGKPFNRDRFTRTNKDIPPYKRN